MTQNVKETIYFKSAKFQMQIPSPSHPISMDPPDAADESSSANKMPHMQPNQIHNGKQLGGLTVLKILNFMFNFRLMITFTRLA